MPTGYTADIYEGKAITFPEFAAKCAHAFGALILFRDEQPSTTLPEIDPEESTYHSDKVREAHLRGEAVRAWTSEEAEREAIADYTQRLASWEKGKAESERRQADYTAMLEQARAWEPPTTEHQNFKEFMCAQLEESIKFDCHDYDSDTGYLAKPKPVAPEAYRAAEIARAERDVKYHSDEADKEIHRQDDRRAWVETLRDSLNAASV